MLRPETRGVKCVLEYEGKILLVRLSYMPSTWGIPGGGVEPGESFVDAARRECWEELGIQVGSLEQIGEYSNSVEYKNDRIHCFCARVDSPRVVIDEVEVVEARWVNPQELPQRVRPHVVNVLRMGGYVA